MLVISCYFIYFAVFKVCAFKIWKFNKKLEVQNFKKTHERKKDVKKAPDNAQLHWNQSSNIVQSYSLSRTPKIARFFSVAFPMIWARLQLRQINRVIRPTDVPDTGVLTSGVETVGDGETKVTVKNTGESKGHLILITW